MGSHSSRPPMGGQRQGTHFDRTESARSSTASCSVRRPGENTCSTHVFSEPKPRENRKFIRDGEGSNISITKDLCTQWFCEIVDELRTDEPMKWTNVAIGKDVGYSDVTIGQYLSGEKQIAAHTVLRMAWSIRWRFLKRMNDYSERGSQ